MIYSEQAVQALTLSSVQIIPEQEKYTQILVLKNRTTLNRIIPKQVLHSLLALNKCQFFMDKNISSHFAQTLWLSFRLASLINLIILSLPKSLLKLRSGRTGGDQVYVNSNNWTSRLISWFDYEIGRICHIARQRFFLWVYWNRDCTSSWWDLSAPSSVLWTVCYGI